ncbi:DUF3667 domain-containing protein [Mucilaginibacter sp. HMF5004]|uniref:DUF3667 domain-containing protein n=1 Tax=Mucilaginibacter rivuli TaxID=2857527 RepID=UPI001C5FE9EE|nr:DUF3667 domain-containing protein [Mucilaginibacter rivuli]MBW4891936.1 DUF3667 domain-containing protein [Mucilaginibacter rivuli]
MKKHFRDETDCLNCGAELQGHYCHVCGQENLQLKENFGHLVVHIVGDYFHFDEKFFHTIKPLFFKPGKLTIEYMEGRRTQYLHPIKMYIFISLIFFLLLFSGKGDNEAIKISGKPLTKEQADSVKNVINNNSWIPEKRKKEITRDIERDRRSDSIHGKRKNNTRTNFFDTGKDTTYEQYLESQKKLAPEKRNGFIGNYVAKREYDWKAKGVGAWEGLMESFKHNAPKMMFLLLPLFAMLLRFTFWRNHKFYVEHLIYAFHLHCFVFLFFTIIFLIKMVLPVALIGFKGIVDFLVMVAVIWYIYRSLRVVYQRSRWGTVWKMFMLSITYTITFSITALFFIVALALFS